MANWASIISLIIVLGITVGGIIWFIILTIRKRKEESFPYQEDEMSAGETEET